MLKERYIWNFLGYNDSGNCLNIV